MLSGSIVRLRSGEGTGPVGIMVWGPCFLPKRDPDGADAGKRHLPRFV